LHKDTTGLFGIFLVPPSTQKNSGCEAQTQKFILDQMQHLRRFRGHFEILENCRRWGGSAAILKSSKIDAVEAGARKQTQRQDKNDNLSLISPARQKQKPDFNVIFYFYNDNI